VLGVKNKAERQDRNDRPLAARDQDFDTGVGAEWRAGDQRATAERDRMRERLNLINQ
jgi:hypothetical protein